VTPAGGDAVGVAVSRGLGDPDGVPDGVAVADGVPLGEGVGLVLEHATRRSKVPTHARRRACD
jgi:hypothetical protein